MQAALLVLFTPAPPSGLQPHVLIVACFSLFASILAAQLFRAQSLAAFAGLAAHQLLTFLYYSFLLMTLLVPMPFVEFALNTDWANGAFFLLLSVHWLSLALFSPRPLPAAAARPFFWQWLLQALISCAMIFGLGLLESYMHSALALTPGFYNLVQQIASGLAAGILLIAALVLAYRNLKTRQALWFWIFAAALLAALAVTIHYQFPSLRAMAVGTLGAASAFIILGLLADRARFIALESELRRNLMDSAGKWEEQARELTAAMAHGSEAIVHVDLDERVVYANAAFTQLAAKPEAVAGRPLKTVLPRPLYDGIMPALQEARRGRAARMDFRCRLGAEEKVMQVAHAPLWNEREKMQGVHLGLMEVTRYHRAERAAAAALAEKTRELRMFQQGVENAAEAIVILDAQHEIVYANDAFVRTTGLSRNEILGRNAGHYRPPPSYPWPEIKRRLAQNKPWRGEVSVPDAAGRVHASDLSVVPVDEAEEPLRRYLWIERDVTAQAIAQRTQELERRILQTSKLMEISADIRLNTSPAVIMQSVANAIHTLGWQRVAVFHARAEDQFELVATAGFDGQQAAVPRKFRQLTYADFAPYLLETFRLSSSFFIDSQRLSARPQFMPRDLPVFAVGEWREHDCLLTPIRAGEQYAGMIATFCPQDGRRPDQQQVRNVEVFADDALIALQNSRLMELHAANESRLRALNRIGNTFRAAGTLEQVVSEIAGMIAEALNQPALIAVRVSSSSSGRPSHNGNAAAVPAWLAASARVVRKGKIESQLLTLSAAMENALDRVMETAVEHEIREAEFAAAGWQELAKLLEDASHASARAKILALRSRQENFGCVLWGHAEDGREWEEDQLRFARDLGAQAALTIDNARLFLQTEEKAHALEHANQLISEFLASVSHELRTPLHAILQFSEILLGEKPGALNGEQKRQIGIVQLSGRSLLNLINDILDLSKIEAGKMEASWQEFDPVEMIREIAATIRPLCLDKGLALHVAHAPSLPRAIVSDRYMLARVLTNLLGNAVKFTDRGEVRVMAEYHNRELILHVRDTGAGIPAARIKEIFEPFHQLENSATRKHRGTGLGLAICRRLTDILGGQIDVRSEEGKGSTFTIRLPVREATPVAAKARRQKVAAPQAPAKNEKSAKRPGFFSKWRSAARKKKRTILVVEDDENTRYAMQFILEDAGYHVTFADNGEKALLATQYERPDVILMDIMMPNLDGHQTARLLKAQKQLQHIPLIALTARAMKGEREKALAAGYDDYLTKPFEKKDILAVIGRWLEEG